ncbi:GNAT family N-acetyltransferase [Rhizobium sp. KVB221]|uniref:GNAT family N-acetyltransferase n=1 Tax=Rhizobium setariae TaxID=2801340 RepID=A0A936YMH9_9HYPH|nr:GNAT family N-acetyltransferase [Rhizobium setariae]MBL0373259.1 GNAT family N-acetyltransferase [Rhizobium setariae]
MPNHRIISDVSEYREDWERLYAGYATYYKVEQSAEMRDKVWNWIREGRTNCLMALDADGRPVGIAHVREFIRPLMATVGGYLDDLYVDPTLRGAGVVDDLFAAAKDLGRARGWSLIRWITREDNYRARAVYDRLATKTNWTTYDLVL